MDYLLDSDIDCILMMELRYGPLQKTMAGGYSMDKADALHQQLLTLLIKYQKELNIKAPVPKIRSWTTDDKVNFLFFDKITGRRILLGSWLSGEETYSEQ